MAFVPVPNTVEVLINSLYFEQRCQNTLYFEREAAFSIADLENIAATVITEWKENNLPLVSNSLTLTSVIVRDLTTQFSPSIEQSTTSGNVGGQVSPGMPGNVTVTIKFLTALRGRAHRGRNYIVGLVENQCVGNTYDSGTAALHIAAYEELATTLNVAYDVDHVVVSRFLDGAQREEGETTIVTDYQIELFLDSQRRRLTGRGQ